VGQVVKVLQEAGALKPESNELLPLGEVAASARGINELWLAIAFTGGILNSLDPAQLAAACACLVSDGMKSRSKEGPTRYVTSLAYTHVVLVFASLLCLNLLETVFINCKELVLQSLATGHEL